MKRHLAATDVVTLVLFVTCFGSASPAAVSAPLVVELETLAASAGPSGGDLVVQPMASFGQGWGANAQLFWRPPTPVHEPIRNYPHLSMLFNVPAAGDYELTLQHTLAPDYGRFTVLVAGRKAADVDGYGTAVKVSRRALGRFRLDAGANQITFTVFGKAAGSTGYVVGLDRLEAIRVDVAAPTLRARPNERTMPVAEPSLASEGSTTDMQIGQVKDLTLRPADPAAGARRARSTLGKALSLQVQRWYVDGTTSGLNRESVWASSTQSHYSSMPGTEMAPKWKNPNPL